MLSLRSMLQYSAVYTIITNNQWRGVLILCMPWLLYDWQRVLGRTDVVSASERFLTIANRNFSDVVEYILLFSFFSCPALALSGQLISSRIDIIFFFPRITCHHPQTEQIRKGEGGGALSSRLISPATIHQQPTSHILQVPGVFINIGFLSASGLCSPCWGVMQPSCALF